LNPSYLRRIEAWFAKVRLADVPVRTRWLAVFVNSSFSIVIALPVLLIRVKLNPLAAASIAPIETKPELPSTKTGADTGFRVIFVPD
jgi:hypothetical protein